MDYTQIEYAVDEHVATITLNRPDKLNAFTVTMMREMIDAFGRIDADDDVRAVIVTGAGRGFCAGADLSGGGGTFEHGGSDQTEARVIRLTFIALAIAVALGLLMASLVTRRLLGSFRHLLAATEAAERGHYDKDVPVNSQDEIGRLSRAFNQMLAELRLKQRIQDTFGRYVDPKVVKDLIDQPERTGSAGDRRVMTVAFADMQGFTRLSEDVTPATLVTLLNRYLTVLTDEVRARHGIVDKYIGDAVMSFWGPPFVSDK